MFLHLDSLDRRWNSPNFVDWNHIKSRESNNKHFVIGTFVPTICHLNELYEHCVEAWDELLGSSIFRTTPQKYKKHFWVSGKGYFFTCALWFELHTIPTVLSGSDVAIWTLDCRLKLSWCIWIGLSFSHSHRERCMCFIVNGGRSSFWNYPCRFGRM